MTALDIDLVLVPVDGSDESATAVEYAVEIADRYGASVHAVYVLPREIVRAIETDSIDDDEVAAESEAFTETAAGIAAERDVPFTTSTAYGFSTRIKSQHPGSVILDTADSIDADFIVVPREPFSESDDSGEVLEKAAEYVLLYASQPVLSV